MRLESFGDQSGAIAAWQAALTLLPDPKVEWEAALWLYASIGDTMRAEGRYEDAEDMLFNALNCPDAHANAFVNLRLGQTLVGAGKTDQGVEYLLRAYMLAGKGIFAEDALDALSLLHDRRLID